MARNKETVTLGLEYKDEGVKDGLKDIDNQLEGLGSSVKNFAANFAANLASNAVMGAINLLKTGISGVTDEIKNWIEAAGDIERINTKLEVALKNSGTSFEDQQNAIRETQDAMFDYAGVGEDTVNKMLADLTIITGDFSKAQEQLPVVLDLVASGLVGEDIAMRGVALAMDGNVSALSRYLPALRGMSEEQAKAGGAMEVFRKLQGLATKDTNTFGGSIETAQESLRNFRGLMGEGITDALTPVLGKISKTLDDMKNSGAAREFSAQLGRITQNIINAAESLKFGADGKGLTESLGDLLDKLESYTGDGGKFADDLQSIAAALVVTAKAVGAMIKVLQAYAEVSTFLPKQAIAGAGALSDVFDATAATGAQQFAHGGAINGADLGVDSELFLGRPGEFVMNQEQVALHGGIDELEDERRRLFGGAAPINSGGFLSGGPVESFIKRMTQAHGPTRPNVLGVGGNLSVFHRGGAAEFDHVMQQIRGASDFETLAYIMDQSLGLTARYGGAERLSSNALHSQVKQWALKNSTSDARRSKTEEIDAIKMDAIARKATVAEITGDLVPGGFMSVAPGQAEGILNNLELSTTQGNEVINYSSRLFPGASFEEPVDKEGNIIPFHKRKFSRADYSGLQTGQSGQAGPDQPFSSSFPLLGDNVISNQPFSSIPLLFGGSGFTPEGMQGQLPMAFFSQFMDFFKRGSGFASGGFVPGDFRGQERLIKAHAGEQIISNAEQALPGGGKFGRGDTSRGRGAGGVGTRGMIALGHAGSGQLSVDKRSQTQNTLPHVSEQAVGDALVNILKNNNLDLHYLDETARAV